MRDFILDKDRAYEFISRIRDAGECVGKERRKDVIDEAHEYLRGQTIAYTDVYLAGLLAGLGLVGGEDDR